MLIGGVFSASSFTKRGLAFSLPSLLRVEVYKIERDGKVREKLSTFATPSTWYSR